jgi:hypothetical protein
MSELNARSRAQKGKSGVSKSAPLVPSLHFRRKNGLVALAAIATIGLGYVLLSKGGTDLAAFLLVVGYLVLIPLAIVVK